MISYQTTIWFDELRLENGRAKFFVKTQPQELLVGFSPTHKEFVKSIDVVCDNIKQPYNDNDNHFEKPLEGGVYFNVQFTDEFMKTLDMKTLICVISYPECKCCAIEEWLPLESFRCWCSCEDTQDEETNSTQNEDSLDKRYEYEDEFNVPCSTCNKDVEFLSRPIKHIYLKNTFGFILYKVEIAL